MASRMAPKSRTRRSDSCQRAAASAPMTTTISNRPVKVASGIARRDERPRMAAASLTEAAAGDTSPGACGAPLSEFIFGPLAAGDHGADQVLPVEDA